MHQASNGEKKECFSCSCCHCHGFCLLRIAFTILPIIAGLDKFFNFLTNWEQYLSTPFNVLGNAHTTMMVVGIIEIIAGIGVWFLPKIFGYIVALWILFIIINLLILGQFYDIALRDFALLLSALALARISCGTCENCGTCKSCGACKKI